MAKTLMEETCETARWVENPHPSLTREKMRMVKCGELAVIEALRPVPAFLCLDCAVAIHASRGLTWRRLPRARKWHTESPMEGTHL